MLSWAQLQRGSIELQILVALQRHQISQRQSAIIFKYFFLHRIWIRVQDLHSTFLFLSNVSNLFFSPLFKVFFFEGNETHHLDDYLEVFFWWNCFSQSVYGRPQKRYLYGNIYFLAVCEIPKIELTDFEKIVHSVCCLCFHILIIGSVAWNKASSCGVFLFAFSVIWISRLLYNCISCFWSFVALFCLIIELSSFSFLQHFFTSS